MIEPEIGANIGPTKTANPRMNGHEAFWNYSVWQSVGKGRLKIRDRNAQQRLLLLAQTFLSEGELIQLQPDQHLHPYERFPY